MLRESDQDTISAISTPLGEGGIGIIRLSGKDAVVVTDKIFRARGGKIFSGNQAVIENGIAGNRHEIFGECLLAIHTPCGENQKTKCCCFFHFDAFID